MACLWARRTQGHDHGHHPAHAHDHCPPTDMRITTMAEADLLKLSQWLVAAFPVSSYDLFPRGWRPRSPAGRVADAAGLRDWVAGVSGGRGGAERHDPHAGGQARHARGRRLGRSGPCAGRPQRAAGRDRGAGPRLDRDAGRGLGDGDGVARPYPWHWGWTRANLEVSGGAPLPVLFPAGRLQGASSRGGGAFRAVGAGRGGSGCLPACNR